MTANDVFKTAAAYLSQTVEDSAEVAEFVPEWLNVLLAECLPVENMLRRFDGALQLQAAPRITTETMDAEIPYHDTLLCIALPYGLAVNLFRDDDNDYRANEYQGKYNNALFEAQRVRPERIRDVY